jgi:hypothetical protein
MRAVRTQPAIRLHAVHRIQLVQSAQQPIHVFRLGRMHYVDIKRVDGSAVKESRNAAYQYELNPVIQQNSKNFEKPGRGHDTP